MKTEALHWYICLVIVAVIALAGCQPGSILVRGDDCKINGSFETLKNGLPVNWWYYAMETVSTGDFDILSDSAMHKEGKRSLKFQVRSCEATGGWHSPGFFQEFKVKPGETYIVSFWVINDNCDFKVSVGAGMQGNPGPNKTLLRTKESYSEWNYFEYTFDIPQANENIRFEVNILSPGTIWFDDIRIEGVNEKKELNLYPYRGAEDCE